MLTYEEAIRNWSYDPETGNLTWVGVRRSRRNVDDYAGSITSEGYLKVFFNGKNYGAHRVIWLMVYGNWPAEQIDHIDGDRSNNQIKNLRDVSKTENLRNAKRSVRNKSGVTGVCYMNDMRRWVATIGVESKMIHLGHFSEKSEAIAARKAAEVKYGYHPNHGSVK